MCKTEREIHLKKIKELIKRASDKEKQVCIFGCGNIGTNFGYQALKNLNIQADFYTDNNQTLWGKEIKDGVKCVAVNQIDKENTIFFVMMTEAFEYKVCLQLYGIGIDQIVTWRDLCEIRLGDLLPCMKGKQIAVYTCVCGDYDEVQEPISISEQCDYYIVTDKKKDRESVFQYIDIDNYVPSDITSNTRKNRYCKINAHKLFPKYKYSIYIDGNFRINEDIVSQISRLPSKTRMITFSKNLIQNVYLELAMRMETRRDIPDLFLKQAEKYWLEGMPDDFGSVTCPILIREHNNPTCKKLMEDWWKEIEKYSNRDQVSLPYVLWKNGYQIGDVGTLTDIAADSGAYWEEMVYHKKEEKQY